MFKIITFLLISIQLSSFLAQKQNFDCQFYLFTKSNRTNPIAVNDITLAKSGYNGLRKTIFVVHGFNDGLKVTIMKEIIEELLKVEDVTPIFVDWNEGSAGPNYLTAATNVVSAGRKIAEFIQKANIDPMKVHCIGHSLGSHVCGNVGKVRQIKRISGLDPAGPLFFSFSESRLKSSDADYVDVIHTHPGYLGYNDPLGHIDFYPNPGTDSTQPGCDRASLTFSLFYQKFDQAMFVACSHMRVIPLYADTIRSGTQSCKFQSQPCTFLDAFAAILNPSKCKCDPSGCPVMGYYVDKNAKKNTGTYYLKTKASKPYCLN